MQIPIDEREAYLALNTVERRRQQVVAEIGIPRWYWLSLAFGWVGLGALSQWGPAWAAAVGTILFGATHSVIAPHVIHGRRGSSQLSVRSDLVNRRLPFVIIGFLVLMACLTTIFALVLNADGDGHPAFTASVVAALLVLTGGPTLVSALRRRAERW